MQTHVTASPPPPRTPTPHTWLQHLASAPRPQPSPFYAVHPATWLDQLIANVHTPAGMVICVVGVLFCIFLFVATSPRPAGTPTGGQMRATSSGYDSPPAPRAQGSIGLSWLLPLVVVGAWIVYLAVGQHVA